MAGRVRVEIAGGLVGQQQARPVGDRPRDGDALLLAARQLRRPVHQPVLEAEEAQKLGGAAPRLLAREPADELGHHHVLLRRELGQQVVELVDEAHLLAAQARALGVAHRRGGLAADIYLAPVRPLQQAGDVQERRLAGTRRGHEGHQLAGPDRQVGAAQDLEGALGLLVAPLHPGEEQRRHRLCAGGFGRGTHRRRSLPAQPYRKACTGSSRAARQEG
ncbi:hypothetical protein AEGHOMDF_3698 [Methylobacterium soli]|nr:hypothetical protein AEGHOMDF_3698 [Methylobacterium soli]